MFYLNSIEIVNLVKEIYKNLSMKLSSTLVLYYVTRGKKNLIYSTNASRKNYFLCSEHHVFFPCLQDKIVKHFIGMLFLRNEITID